MKSVQLFVLFYVDINATKYGLLPLDFVTQPPDKRQQSEIQQYQLSVENKPDRNICVVREDITQRVDRLFLRHNAPGCIIFHNFSSFSYKSNNPLFNNNLKRRYSSYTPRYVSPFTLPHAALELFWQTLSIPDVQ